MSLNIQLLKYSSKYRLQKGKSEKQSKCEKWGTDLIVIYAHSHCNDEKHQRPGN